MRVLVYFTLLAFAAGAALFRGTPVERRLAGVMVVGNLATLAAVHAESSGQYSSVSLWYFLIDTLVAVAFCWVAVQWPSWASVLIAAFQVNGLFGHLVKLVSPDIFPLSYAMLLKIWGWAMVAVLLMTRYRPWLRHLLSGERWPSFSKVRDGRPT